MAMALLLITRRNSSQTCCLTSWHRPRRASHGQKRRLEEGDWQRAQISASWRSPVLPALCHLHCPPLLSGFLVFCFLFVLLTKLFMLIALEARRVREAFAVSRFIF